ncbi:RidA family protein [Paenibacillaceae bacterium WGS1546]|uniref:RidA family protein n=1 Tax=Cohnella sp. WGS1546 TaxID=3366810 RepID=UPI00372D55AC
MNRQAYETIKIREGYKEGAPSNVYKPYVPVKIVDGMAYVSGNVAFSGDELLYKGVIGGNLTIEEGKKSAALAAVNCLELLEKAIGLDKVATIVKVTGYLRCAEHVEELPSILNAGSQVFVDVFGEENGKHARAALGMYTLPLGASAEIEFIAKLKKEA